MKPQLTEAEIEQMIKRAIFHHEIRFSIFGVITAVLSLLAGFLLSRM